MASAEPVPATGEPSGEYCPVPPTILTHSRRNVPLARITWLRPSLPTMVLHHRIDGVGTRALELESGSHRWVVGVDRGIEVLAAGHDDYPVGTHHAQHRQDHDRSKADQFE